MSWILAGRGLHFYPAKFVIISVTLVLEVPAVLELSGRNQLMCVMSTLTGKSNPRCRYVRRFISFSHDLILNNPSNEFTDHSIRSVEAVRGGTR